MDNIVITENIYNVDIVNEQDVSVILSNEISFNIGLTVWVPGKDWKGGEKGDPWTTTWEWITDKPTEFTPSEHNHDTLYYRKNIIDELLLLKANSDHTHTAYEQQIQNILDILSSDDTTLDELQEIVNYIKQNKQILEELSISNIAWLWDALGGKAEVNHEHNDLYYTKEETRSQAFISSVLFG